MPFYCAVLAILIYVQSAKATVTAEASLWLQQKFDNKSCGQLDSKDFDNYKTYTVMPACSMLSQSIESVHSDMNTIVENEFFNVQAVKQLEGIQCEISKVDKFAASPTLVKARADEISAKLPFISEQMKLADQGYAAFQKITQVNNIQAGYCRSVPAESKKCFADLEIGRAKEAQAKEIWQKHRALALGTTASLWSGGTESIEKLIERLARAKSVPSNETILQELKRAIPLVKKEMTEQKKELLSQSRLVKGVRQFSNLNDTTKKQLIEAALSDGFFTAAATNKDDSVIKLLCRLEGKYTKGRDTLNTTVVASTFLLGGVSGLLAKIPVAVRAGKLGQALVRARASAPVINGFAAGLDAAIVADSVNRSCFEKSLNFNGAPTCPKNSEEFAKSELKTMVDNDCIINAVLDTAPAGILATSLAVKKLKVRLKHAKAIEKTPVAIADKTDADKNSLPDKEVPFDWEGHWRSVTKSLDDMGVTYEDLRTSPNRGDRKELSSYRQKIYMSTKYHEKVDELYDITKGPTVKGKRSAFTEAFKHPDFDEALKTIHSQGYRLVVDTTLSLPKVTLLGSTNNHSKIIRIRPDISWSTLVHEIQHMEFGGFISKHYDAAGIKVRSGSKIEDALPPESLAKYSKKELAELQKYLNIDAPELAINERLSGMRELQTQGFRRYLPKSDEAQQVNRYADSYLRPALEQLKKAGNITPAQLKVLNEIEKRERVDVHIGNAPFYATMLAGSGVSLGFVYNVLTGESFFQAAKGDPVVYIAPDKKVPAK